MSFSLADLLAYLGRAGLISGPAPAKDDVALTGFSSLHHQKPSTVSWAREDSLQDRPQCAVMICGDHYAGREYEGTVFIRTKNPRLAFIRAIAHFSDTAHPTGVHPTALVHPSARVGQDTYIGPYSVIGEGAVIGDGTVIHACVYVCSPTRIGRKCLIHGGVVIGADGFGFERTDSGELIKFPHVGGVVIEDEVEIGANTCIDRGTLDDTIIGKGAKIDDHCYIAHNTLIGEHVVVAANVTVCGSAALGPRAWIAPGAVIREAVRVGEGATVALGAVVVKHVPDRDTVAGVPARSMRLPRR